MSKFNNALKVTEKGKYHYLEVDNVSSFCKLVQSKYKVNPKTSRLKKKYLKRILMAVVLHTLNIIKEHRKIEKFL